MDGQYWSLNVQHKPQRTLEQARELHSFLQEALVPDKHLRSGQKLIVNLTKTRPDLWQQVGNTQLDCFYDDALMWGTIQWIRDNW